MIICPDCKIELTPQSNKLKCPNCDYSAEIMEGIYFFHPNASDFQDYRSEDLHLLHEAEDKYFWFKTRNSFISSLFEKYVAKSEKIIEVGAGTGNISGMLLRRGYDVSAGEIHKTGLLYAKSYGIREAYQFDVLKSPFIEHFDVVGMFDVLEHIADDALALKNVHQMLKKGGKVILTVPAHEWLWSRNDRVASHKKRYEVKSIKKLFQESGFEALCIKSFFVSILPLLYLRCLLNRDDGSPPREEEYKREYFKISPVFNFMLENILNFENMILKHFSPGAGGSLAVVGKKH
ncbi:MAG: class I SAM-dependent methyltransferase [bacterium]